MLSVSLAMVSEGRGVHVDCVNSSVVVVSVIVVVSVGGCSSVVAGQR